MVNLYALRGLDPDISTEICRVQGNSIHLSTGARIEGVDYDELDRLTFTLRYVQNETSYGYHCGVRKSVQRNGIFSALCNSYPKRGTSPCR